MPVVTAGQHSQIFAIVLIIISASCRFFQINLSVNHKAPKELTESPLFVILT